MIDYKLSNYNFTFPYPEPVDGKKQMVLYNTRTGSMALIEEDKYEQYRDFEINGTSFSEDKLISDLKYGGFLVDNSFDELAAIKHTLFSSRFSTSSLGLTIAPTSDCNFRCIYCYEKDSIKPVTMSEETQEGLICFVKNYIPQIRRFEVCWYGGEPLLAIEIIEKLTVAFLELCEENHIAYSASMVTNGYLLTPETLNKFQSLHIDDIQVTLDGTAEDHDRRRFLKGGHPTFERIIDNLREGKDLLPKQVSIRINADRHNIERVDNVIKTLKENGLEDKVYPYLAMVYNSNDAYNDNSCLRTNESSKFVFDFIMRNGLNILTHIPCQLGNYCCADRYGSFVINADGRLYKCWNEMGIEKYSIGTLKEGVKDCPHLYDYMLYDPTEDSSCRICKFLPVCMGGCPNRREQAPSTRCLAMRHGLNSFMSVIPSILKKQKEKNSCDLQAE